MADQKLTALSALSVPALEDLSYIVDDPSGTPASYKSTHARLGGLYVPGICDFRLTTESGVPVSTTERTAQSTIYCTPYAGNRIALYDGTRWGLITTAEVSLALSGLTGDKLYDVFAYDNSGTVTLELSSAWTNNTTRADALTRQDGIYVKSGATTRRYLGTFFSQTSTTTADTGGGVTTQVGGQRLLWNYYHRVPRPLAVFDSTASWTYTTNAWRNAGASGTNLVQFVIGIAEDAVTAVLQAGYQVALNGYGAAGIGLDSTTTIVGAGMLCYSAGDTGGMMAQWNGYPGIGHHYLAWNENGLGSGAGVTFYGSTSSIQVSRLMAVVQG